MATGDRLRLSVWCGYAFCGCFITTLVAWSFASRSRLLARPPGFYIGQVVCGIDYAVSERVGERAMLMEVVPEVFFGSSAATSDPSLMRASILNEIAKAPRWSLAHEVGRSILVQRDQIATVWIEEHAFGWPMLAFVQWEVDGRMTSTPPPSNRFYEHSPRFGDQLELPLSPLWVGFFLDSILYGGFSLVLCRAALSFRALLRHRRGQCPTCRYSLVGLKSRICPECGTALAESIEATAPADPPRTTPHSHAASADTTE